MKIRTIALASVNVKWVAPLRLIVKAFWRGLPVWTAKSHDTGLCINMIPFPSVRDSKILDSRALRPTVMHFVARYVQNIYRFLLVSDQSLRHLAEVSRLGPPNHGRWYSRGHPSPLTSFPSVEELERDIPFAAKAGTWIPRSHGWLLLREVRHHTHLIQLLEYLNYQSWLDIS